MAQAERGSLRPEAEISTPLPRLAPERRRLLARRQDRAGLGRHVRPLPVERPRDPAPHPPPLRRRRRARPQQRGRGRHLSAQHRARLHARRLLVERVARATAEEVAATGIDWTFSPCVAVARDERWGRTYESFGETPELVVRDGGGRGARATSRRILACAKHYLADGGTAGGRDQGDAQIDEATLRAIHLPGYAAAIAAGVGSVMASFSSWNGQKMHGHRYLLTDVLKGELGFQGFVVSDWTGDRSAAGRLRVATSRPRSTPASTWSWCPSDYAGLHRHAEDARPVRPDPACRASTTPSGASCGRRSRSASGSKPLRRPRPSCPRSGSDAHRQIGPRGGAKVARPAEERRARPAALRR